jgi:hypothetical protein
MLGFSDVSLDSFFSRYIVQSVLRVSVDTGYHLLVTSSTYDTMEISDKGQPRILVYPGSGGFIVATCDYRCNLEENWKMPPATPNTVYATAAAMALSAADHPIIAYAPAASGPGTVVVRIPNVP